MTARSTKRRSRTKKTITYTTKRGNDVCEMNKKKNTERNDADRNYGRKERTGNVEEEKKEVETKGEIEIEENDEEGEDDVEVHSHFAYQLFIIKVKHFVVVSKTTCNYVSVEIFP